MKAFDLTGHGALVTGGNSGIGLGMAEGLAEAGANVVIWGTNEKKNETAQARLDALGPGKAIAMQCDVGDPEQIAASFAATLDALGRVDSCFANAGVGGAPVQSFTDISIDEWRRVLRINLEGVLVVFQHAARHMMERGEGGSLVATSSLSSMEGQPRSLNYGSSKGGINALVRGLAVELGRHKIRANAIVPGWIDTPMTAPLMSWETFEKKVLSRVPIRRWGKPEDFGPLAVLLASPASEYLTGQTIVIDGGYSIF